MASEAQTRASVKYNKKMDSITIRPLPEDGAQVRAAAAASGLPLQRYILQACREKMERDGFSVQPKDSEPEAKKV